MSQPPNPLSGPPEWPAAPPVAPPMAPPAVPPMAPPVWQGSPAVPPPFGPAEPAEPATGPWPGAPATAVEAWHGRIPLRRPTWGFGDALIALLGALLFSVGAGVLLLVNSDSTDWQNWVILLGLVAQWIPMIGWPLLVTRWKGNGPRIDLGLSIRRTDLVWGVGGGLVVLAAAGAVGWLTQQVFGEFNSSAGELVTEFESNRLQLALLCLAIGVGAPIVEEVCFRGLFWGSLAKRGISPWWVTVWTALAFSLFHVEPVRMPLLFVTGLLLGYLRQRTGRLGAPILAHMVNNLAGVLSIFVT